MAQAAPAPRGTSRTPAGRHTTSVPPAGPAPTLRILETRVLRGPELLGARAGHPAAGRPRRAGAVPLQPAARTSPMRWSPCCPRSRTTPARWAAAAASSPACARGRGSATSPSTSRSSSRTWPAPTSATARRAAAGKPGQYNCIYEYREEAVGLEAGRMAVALVNHLVAPDDPDVFFDFAPELERLIRLAERQAFGPSTQALIDEAVSRDIPFIRLDRHSLVQFGHGVHQQRIRATMTSQTSAIGVDVASDKSLTNQLLDSAGLPVPRGEVVDSEDGAVSAAQAARLPVRGQAARRQPRPRRPPRPAVRGGRPRRVPRGRRPEPRRRRRRRDVRGRQRLPLPGHRRQGRGHRRARAGVRDRRRRAHRPRAGGHRQQRPAPRHRPREGADPDQGRRGGRGAGRAPRATRWTTSCRPGRGSSWR